jgi:hypothetical protein
MQSLNTFIEDYGEKGWLHAALILIFCYVAFALPLQIYGLPSGFDMLTVIRFSTAFQDAFASGQLLPSWTNDNFGYGSVGIRFYPPLSLFVLAITQVVTDDWFTAFLTNLYLWMVVGCAGMYLFVKEWGTPKQGLMAAVLYAVIPQHLAEIFQFFMFAEFAVWAFLPFCFLYATRVCRGGNWKDVTLLAISLSLLILTHLPTTIIVALCLPIYVLTVMDWSKWKQVFIHLSGAITLTLLATAFRWVMLVSEVKWLAHDGPEHYASGYYEFSQWLFPNVLAPRAMFVYVLTSWLFDIAIVLTVALMIPAVLSLFRSQVSPSIKRVIIAASVTALFAFFMLSRPSFHVWNNLVFLQKLQFPWRWLSVLSMLSVLLFAISIPHLMARFRNRQRLIAYPALALVVTIVLFDITQIIIPSAPVPSAEFAEVEKKIHTEQIWKGWWPSWAKEKAFENVESSGKVSAGSRTVEITSWDRESKEFFVQPGDAISVGVQTFYYPLWKATVNGHPTELSMDESGAITIPLTTEASTVRLTFEEPIPNRFASWISAVVWLIPVILLPVFFGFRYLSALGPKRIVGEEFDYT